MRRFGCFLMACCFSLGVWGNNVKIDSIDWKTDAVSFPGNQLKMTFVVSWENSWRDFYNYDAVYVFFKFKKKEEVNTSEKTAKEDWHHLFLLDEGNRLTGANADDFAFRLSPLSSDGIGLNAGIYIYRKQQGQWGSNRVKMEVTWDVTRQIVDKQLTADNVRDGKVLISGQAIEMVYIPRGPFRLGDGQANKGFANVAFPLPAEYDVINTSYTFDASSGDPVQAADRMNDNAATDNSAWIGTSSGENRWWVDFGEGVEKTVTYFGVNASSSHPTYIPTRFRLEGSHDPTAAEPDWKILWEGEGAGNWIVAEDAYPVYKAIKLDRSNPDFGSYRSYRIVVEGMKAGYPIVKSIGMSCENDLESLLNHTVLVDSPKTRKDSISGLWAHDGSVWTQGELPALWPNGYKGFYAMKYEISQEQYASFLNKLNYQQQNNILDGRLDAMKEGEYIFGDRSHADARNGIILATKITGMPAVFACNLNPEDGADQETDGQNLACNYMNIADMLAYADWACLRPLSEMEYEKMCRRLYPEMPVKGEYAWHTAEIVQQQLSDLQNPGTPGEKGVNGNANYGNVLAGPVRVGAFAENGKGRVKSGNSFWGVAELSGNLAEMYYNVNNTGLQVLAADKGSGTAIAGHDTSHGDGSIDGTKGTYNGAKTKYWSETAAAIALRGGSYISAKEELQVSDRTWSTGYFQSLTSRDSVVTFRLGHSVPDGAPLASWLILENELTTEAANALDIMVRPDYLLEGNVPEGVDERECTYLWYASENGGNWKVLDGACDRDYYFDKYSYMSIDTVTGYDYRFKRKVVSPYADSEISSEHQAVIKGAFSSSIEYFDYTGDTYQVKCEWDASIPKEWSILGESGTIKINKETGLLSGLTSTSCNLVIAVADRRTPDILYTKRVRERKREFAASQMTTVRLTPGTYQVECWGAQGGSYNTNRGGYGGYTTGLLTLDTVKVFYVYVGGVGGGNGAYTSGGWNGGANGGWSDGSKGGGASDIRVNGTDLKNRIMVAGGGGGSADWVHGYGTPYFGGHGGSIDGTGSGVNGGIEAEDNVNRIPAKAGTQTAGGSAAINKTSYPNTGYAGTWGVGGSGPGNVDAGYNHSGGGGGGGYYGGGGGCAYYQGGGGGGSSFISGYPGCNAVDANGKHTGQPVHFSGLFFKNMVVQIGARTGNGLVRITAK